MNADLVSRLVDLNHLFYQTFAGPFAATRQRIQPGVQVILNRLLDGLDQPASLLDLGCGNGELARRLARRGYSGYYLGLDFSEGLLEEARALLADFPRANVQYQAANLAAADWDRALGSTSFETVLSFAVLHHIPSAELRQAILSRVRERLAPGGRFYCSVWQFLNSPRLAARVLPWETMGIDPDDLDPGDYLLDWRAGGQGYRYVHHFDEGEMAALAAFSGFEVVETFYNDGENGRLGMYQVWE